IFQKGGSLLTELDPQSQNRKTVLTTQYLNDRAGQYLPSLIHIRLCCLHYCQLREKNSFQKVLLSGSASPRMTGPCKAAILSIWKQCFSKYANSYLSPPCL